MSIEARMHFPLTLPARWSQTIPDSVTKQQLDWLAFPGSLTARLKTQGQSFSVTVLGQSQLRCDGAIIGRVGLQRLTVREVLLNIDGVAWVYAQSQWPTDEIADLQGLGQQPLGEVLFMHPQTQRGPIEFAEFSSCDDLSALLAELPTFSQPAQAGQCLARRSVFFYQQAPISVCEVFLPASKVMRDA